VVLDADGRLAGRYRKMHIPDDPHYYEKFYFTPGDLDFTAHRTAHATVGALVCWDQWFPEAARLVALAGAQIVFYPTAIGWERSEVEPVRRRQLQAWETVQRGHAIANGMFVAVANRVGAEDSLEFWGNSFVVDPFGEVIGRAGTSAEEILIVDCDLALIEETRRNWPFLRDRRIDAYGDLLRRFRS
jgi:N-carbamoylputrescine amidase